LSTTNPTWPDPGSNPGRRGGKPATNRLSYGAAGSAKCEYNKQLPCPLKSVELNDRLNDYYKNDWDLIDLFSNPAKYEGNSSKADFICHSFDNY
jgi:hypothetical protein